MPISTAIAPGRAARFRSLGRWSGGDLVDDPKRVEQALCRVGEPLVFVQTEAGPRLALGGRAELGVRVAEGAPIVAWVPPLRPADLGDPGFRVEHGLRSAYVVGAMANGIASTRMVESVARAGYLAFFGAAGLPAAQVEAAVDRLATRCAGRPWGANLIHSPAEPRLEEAVVDVYLRRGVDCISASAYLDLTLPLLRYRYEGIQAHGAGDAQAPRRVVAKVSRVEVATKFLNPPSERWIRAMLEACIVDEAQAAQVARVPVADDLTVEADSGGHTDNRPAMALLPTMMALRDRVVAERGGPRPRIGAAGGLGTPHAVAGAFAMGADYVVTGSVNQACVESGSSDRVRSMLAQAQQPDMAMAPAADMFEMGVELQVLKRGTMFPMRARKLYELYRAYPSIEALPAEERASLEKNVFRASLDDIWAQTRDFWLERDAAQVERAERDPHHRMALVFRWYLGMSSRWANRGEAGRELDYQVWCGPAMGAFNEWTRGTHLEEASARKVVDVADNLLWGACVIQRVQALRAAGVAVEGVDLRPRSVAQIEEACA